MLKYWKKLEFRLEHWNLYNNEWICLFAGMIIGGAFVMLGFLIGANLINKVLQ